MEKLICQGAEAKVYLSSYQDEPYVIIKERISKGYRHPELDARITRERIKSESKCMEKAKSAGVNVPNLLLNDAANKKIYMQYVTNSLKARDFFSKCSDQDTIKKLLKDIGEDIAKLHDIDMIHGDLTTSNILVQFNQDPEVSGAVINNYEKIFFIDFGLSYVKSNNEDKAVDLYVLERAFISTHPEIEPYFQILLDSYANYLKNGKKVLNKLEDVRSRGRKKLAFG